MAKYRVEMPFRAVQFFEVEAGSKAEAKRLAAEGAGDLVETIDWRVIQTYAPNHAELVEKAVQS